MAEMQGAGDPRFGCLEGRGDDGEDRFGLDSAADGLDVAIEMWLARFRNELDETCPRANI